MGGPIKIYTVQNVITLRSDLHDAWDNYEFVVDPNVSTLYDTRFIPRDLIFCVEQLPHNCLYQRQCISPLGSYPRPTLRPLDELFTGHFMHGLFKHMKGAGSEAGWTYKEYDDAFGDGSLNLSNSKTWGTREGKERFELALSDCLFDYRMSQQNTAETVE